MRNNSIRILAGIIFICMQIFFINPSQAVPEFNSFDEVPFETLPSTFEAKIGGEYYILATGRENIPSGINMTAAQEIALDRAELKARGELVEFIQNGELEKTSFNSTAYSSSEGSSNSSTLNTKLVNTVSQTVRTKMIRGIEALYIDRNPRQQYVYVVVGLSPKSLSSADSFRKLLEKDHARKIPASTSGYTQSSSTSMRNNEGRKIWRYPSPQKR